MLAHVHGLAARWSAGPPFEAVIKASPGANTPQPESKPDAGELERQFPQHLNPTEASPSLTQTAVFAPPAPLQQTSAPAIQEPIDRASSEHLVPTAASQVRAPVTIVAAADQAQRTSKTRPYNVPGMRILVPNAIPDTGKQFVARLDGGETVEFRVLATETQDEIKEEFRSYLYAKSKLAGVDWWINLLKLRRQQNAKPVCMPIMFNHGGQSTWTAERPVQYACLTCTNKQRLCLFWDEADEKINLLPLVPEARGCAGPKDPGYWVRTISDQARVV